MHALHQRNGPYHFWRFDEVPSIETGDEAVAALKARQAKIRRDNFSLRFQLVALHDSTVRLCGVEKFEQLVIELGRQHTRSFVLESLALRVGLDFFEDFLTLLQPFG